MKKKAGPGNWQDLATEFKPGDKVQLLEGDVTDIGHVVQVWPSIGMIDIQLADKVTRFPVEDLLRLNQQDKAMPYAIEHAIVPGGVDTVSVPGGRRSASIRRVAEAFVRKALYWGARDRQYRPTKSETENGKFCCPRCPDTHLRKAIYKRREGLSNHLLGCPSCFFLIKEEDVLHPPSLDGEEAV